MTTLSLAKPERDCIKKLAEFFQRGEFRWMHGREWEKIGLDETNYLPVLTLLNSIGVIQESARSSAGAFARGFIIQPAVVGYARQIEEQERKAQEPKDVLENLKFTLKRHPVWGWGFVIFASVGAISVVGHHVIAFLKDLKIIAP